MVGYKQRLAAAPLAHTVAGSRRHEQRQLERSSLASLLLDRSAWGRMPAMLVQEIALAAITDLDRGTVEPIRALSRLGASGLHKNNVDRDLRRRLGSTALPMPEEEVVPLKRCLTNQRVTFVNMRYPFLSPHETFSSIYHHYKSAWQKLMCPSESELAAFWRSLRDWPALKDSAIVKIRGFERCCIPLILHGDGVAITSAGKASKGTSRVSRKKCGDFSALGRLAKKLPWSSAGVAPSQAIVCDCIWHIMISRNPCQILLAEAPTRAERPINSSPLCSTTMFRWPTAAKRKKHCGSVSKAV